jgi:hypothetical protein
VDETRKPTSHAPRIVPETGASAKAAPAEEVEKTATSVARNSPERIIIPGHPFPIYYIDAMPRPSGFGYERIGTFFLDGGRTNGG